MLRASMSIVFSALFKGQRPLRWSSVWVRGRGKTKKVDSRDFFPPVHSTFTVSKNKYSEANLAIAREYLSYRS